MLFTSRLRLPTKRTMKLFLTLYSSLSTRNVDFQSRDPGSIPDLKLIPGILKFVKYFHISAQPYSKLDLQPTVICLLSVRSIKFTVAPQLQKIRVPHDPKNNKICSSLHFTISKSQDTPWRTQRTHYGAPANAHLQLLHIQ